jgi:hypothetical protein
MGPKRRANMVSNGLEASPMANADCVTDALPSPHEHTTV